MTTSPRSHRRLSSRVDCDGCVTLSAELAEVSTERDRLKAQVEKLKTEKAALAVKLDEARRAAKRQAAPFSRGARKANGERKRPGRAATGG